MCVARVHGLRREMQDWWTAAQQWTLQIGVRCHRSVDGEGAIQTFVSGRRQASLSQSSSSSVVGALIIIICDGRCVKRGVSPTTSSTCIHQSPTSPTIGHTYNELLTSILARPHKCVLIYFCAQITLVFASTRTAHQQCSIIINL